MEPQASQQPEITRKLPHNLELERIVLGNIFLQSNAINVIADILRPDDFFSPAHSIIYQACLELSEQEGRFDIETLRLHLIANSQLDKCGGIKYLAELFDGSAPALNIKFYADVVRQKSVGRKLIRSLKQLTNLAYEDTQDPDELLELAEEELMHLSNSHNTNESMNISEIMKGTLEQVEILSQNPNLFHGLLMGYDYLDELTTGLKPADYMILAGRPGTGKTAFALNVARNVAVNDGKAVGIFSMEMTKESLSLRLLSIEARFSATRIRKGKLSKADWEILNEASSRLMDSTILIDDNAGLSTMELWAKARRMKASHDIKLLIIDYLQLMSSTSFSLKNLLDSGNGRSQPRRTIESRQQEIAEISRALKNMAKELRIPIIVISQLNRKIEERKDSTPMLSDLRESGAIEQDADIVAFLVKARDKKKILAEANENSQAGPESNYAPSLNKNNEDRIDLILAKQRNGPTGNVKLLFMKDKQYYTSFQETEEEPPSDWPY